MKNITKLFIILVVTIICSSSVDAQERYFDERYIYTQHFIYPVLLNPGAIAHKGHQELLFNYRNTWADFDGSPKTVTINYNGPVGNRLGFGAQLMQDNFGSLNMTKGMVGLNYTIESETNRLGMGISAEYIQHNLSGDDLDLTDPDQLIFQRLDGTQFFDATFGVFGLYNQKLTYGITFPSLISSRIDDSSSNEERNLGYIIQAGYRLESPETNISLEPSIVVKSLMNTPTHVDINARLGFLDDKLTGGFSYTLGGDKRLGFLLGTRVEKLNLFYSYNVSSADFQSYNNGAHEISVSIDFGKNENKDNIKEFDKMNTEKM